MFASDTKLTFYVRLFSNHNFKFQNDSKYTWLRYHIFSVGHFELETITYHNHKFYSPHNGNCSVETVHAHTNVSDNTLEFYTDYRL